MTTGDFIAEGNLMKKVSYTENVFLSIVFIIMY